MSDTDIVSGDEDSDGEETDPNEVEFVEAASSEDSDTDNDTSPPHPTSEVVVAMDARDHVYVNHDSTFGVTTSFMPEIPIFDRIYK
ncbi:hypothetical protein Hamer_G019052 [Homarus americanus]|uniref:Uncharacterized protein n=1 Tax=Homarus americanus TaxID=6706 RepID=A0A8J5K561_HOMAM|nr:hypothetical protein Hamer_G019052 [Homarus americanus]